MRSNKYKRKPTDKVDWGSYRSNYTPVSMTVTWGEEPPIAPPKRLHSVLGRGTMFLGSCYVCGCAQHSSKYCPLRLCQYCGVRCAGSCR